MMTLEVGKTYHYYDDGKIRESRHDTVLITELIPFTEIDSETLSKWSTDASDCYWLYAKETPLFVKGKLTKEKADVIFVRTVSDQWFSLGWHGGLLLSDEENSRLTIVEPDTTGAQQVSAEGGAG
jgi:hypothetical protein